MANSTPPLLLCVKLMVDGSSDRMVSSFKVTYSHNFDVINHKEFPTLSKDQFPARRNSFSNIWLFYQNVRGRKSKLSSFKFSDLAFQHCVSCITESWLDGRILDSKVLDGYSVFRCDRDRTALHKPTGGGNLITIEYCFRAAIIFSSSFFIYHTYVHIYRTEYFAKSVPLYHISCTFSIPQPLSPVRKFLRQIIRIITILFPSLPFKHCGHLNLMPTWPTFSGLPSFSNNSAYSSFPLSTIMNICATLQFNLSKNHLNNILDIVQSSNLPRHCFSQFSHASLRLLVLN